MTDKVLRKLGLFIAAGIVPAGLGLCWEGLEHGDLTGMFIAIAGALWLVSDWSSFNRRSAKSKLGAQAATLPLRWRRPDCAILSVCSALLWAAALANPACSQGQLDLAYTLSFAGISFGDITLSAEIGASEYTMSGEGRLRSFGPTSLSGKSYSEVRGSVSDSRLTPARFSSKSNFEKDPMEVTIIYEDGNVKEVSGLNLGRSRAQLSDADRQAVLDPLTALLVPAGLSNEACQRTVHIFDGYQRFDVALAFKHRSSIKAKEGYAGPAVVCSGRYTPVAGQRGSATVPKFLVDLLVDSEIDITLAPVPGMRVLAPFELSAAPVSGMRVLAPFELSAVSMLTARANRFKAVAR